MKLSKLYGKRIKSADGKYSGTIIAVSESGGELAGFLCAADDETEFFAAFGGCKLRQEIATFTKIGKENAEYRRLRLGLPVYSDSGKLLGAASDITYRGARLCDIVVGYARYPYSLASFGDAIIIKSEKSRGDERAKDMFISALCDGATYGATYRTSP